MNFLVMNRGLPVTALLAVLLAASVVAGMSAGSSDVSLFTVLGRPTSGGADLDRAAAIVWQVRLPRVIMAAAAGATLAAAGLVFQALLRNPLAEPYILGISGGSAVGAIVGMLMGLASFPGIPLAAFGGSMTALGGLFLLTRSSFRLQSDSLLLGGVMVNAFCGALIMFLISLTKNAELHAVLFWLMGDLALFSGDHLPLLLPLVPGLAVIVLLAHRLNPLLLGNEAAASMGLSVQGTTALFLLTTTLMVSVVVCQTGLIGFVGLVIPHIFRLLLGSDHRVLAPAVTLGGASYLILCDLLARTLSPSGELPVGIITALAGAPTFILLLWWSRR